MDKGVLSQIFNFGLVKTSRHLFQPHKIYFLVLVILHLVGGMSCLLGFSDILKLTTLNLLITLSLVLVHIELNGKSILVLLFIFLASFAVEWLGTSTGFPFGEYRYGMAMRPLLFGVPLFIGVNWILVALGSRALAQKFCGKQTPFAVSFVASILMVGMDALIEPICSFADFWHWQLGHAPLENFVAWWVVSLIFQLSIQLFEVKFKNNKLFVELYFVQVSFFLILYVSMVIWN